VEARALIPVVERWLENAGTIEEIRSVLHFVAESETVSQEAARRKEAVFREVESLRSEKAGLDAALSALRQKNAAEEAEGKSKKLAMEKEISALAEKTRTAETEFEKAQDKLRSLKRQFRSLLQEEE
jgi:DNA phosphorothioation-dependent restriction protein DptG